MERYFGDKPKNQPTWRPICDLMLRIDGVASPSKDERLRYMADKLGRKDGSTLLTELMPYPRKRADDRWPYERYDRFADYKTYRTALLPKRLTLLKSVFSAPPPRKLVVAYGKRDWPDFKTLFGETAWTSAKPFEWAKIGGTALVLTPHLSSRAFNSRKDLDRFAAVVFKALQP